MLTLLRSLLKQPAYVALSTVTLMLAVGANLVVFTVVNGLWLRPQPIPHADRVVMVLGNNELLASSEGFYFSDLGLDQSVRSLPVFTQVAGQVATSGIEAGNEPHLTIDRVGHEVETMGVTWQYFSVIGAPIRGRDFTAGDDRVGASPTVIISERLWTDVYGADPGIIGTRVEALPVPVQIIGVAPPGFHGARLGEQADLWVTSHVVPQVATVAGSLGGPGLLAIARLRDGVTVRDAERAMVASNASHAGFPVTFSLVPVTDLYGGPHSRTVVTREGDVIGIAAVTSSLVLVAGCATLMALVLMHYERRRQEFAVRLALGCSRSRLTRSLVADLAMLAIPGMLGAVGITASVIRALPALTFTSGVDFSRLGLSIDGRVLAVGGCITVLTLILAATLPWRRSMRGDLALELVSTSLKATPSSLRIRRAMIAVHVAATVVVLIGAGLFVGTIERGFDRGAGFDLHRTLFVSAQVASNSTAFGVDPEIATSARMVRAQAFIDDVTAIPGVERIAIGQSPIGLDQSAEAGHPTSLRSVDQQLDRPVMVAWVGTGFFDAVGVPLLAGRTLDRNDVVPAPSTAAPQPPQAVRAAVMTASLAKALFPRGHALGQRFRRDDVVCEVVGVVADFAQGSLALDQHMALFLATDLHEASRRFRLFMTVRAASDASELSGPVRHALKSAFPDAVGVDLATGTDVVRRDTGRERLGASFFSGFGLLAFCLGLTGVFGLVAYFVESRRRELGVRMTLGATPGRLLLETARTGLTPVVAGTAIGLAAAVPAARAAKALWVGVGSLDPLTYVATAGLVLVGASAAAITAAARVNRVSPVDALRAE